MSAFAIPSEKMGNKMSKHARIFFFIFSLLSEYFLIITEKKPEGKF
ncbi:hypothetical protein SORDD16_00721 [Streptococcus oralis]|uniref:Uncharacterized protein n=1 Tax=Streptococcus oralis TaxID=1303 RepID=A0A139PES5_STROR|nr:hypothetical protein SORDD16_00721 [Streptococcus oralis]